MNGKVKNIFSGLNVAPRKPYLRLTGGKTPPNVTTMRGFVALTVDSGRNQEQ